MKLVDLHMHSTFSDGSYTPTELVKFALEANLSTIAITDHDSWNGVVEAREAAKTFGDLKIITGIELGTQVENKNFHILGYGVAMDYKPLEEAMSILRNAREERLNKILLKLEELGYPVEIEASERRNRAVGRPHVATAMVEKGHVETIQEAFHKFLSLGRPAYISQYKLSIEEAIDLIHKAGGVAILAHPEEVKNRELILEVFAGGAFDGIEVYHPSADKEAQEYWKNFASKNNLLITGGSDFHGVIHRFPKTLKDFQVKAEDVKAFLDLKLG